MGELTPELCVACHEAGINSAYHVLRLREGVDTPFDPEDRKRTIRAIVESPLKWNTNIEPVGPEHTNDELADSMLFALAHPSEEDGLTCGANNFSVERGAIPRDDSPVEGEWRGKTPAYALETLRAAGYRPCFE